MATENTERDPRASAQEAAAEALLELTRAFGHLPIPYVTIHRTLPIELCLLLGTAAYFEEWRAALLIAPNAVELESNGATVWLKADGYAHGVPVHLTCHGVALPARTDENVQVAA